MQVQVPPIAVSAALLVVSNVFNRIGLTRLSLAQLKIVQELITLVVFRA